MRTTATIKKKAGAKRGRRAGLKADRREARNIGNEMIAAAKEAIEFERGNDTGARVNVIARSANVKPAPDYTKEEIAAIRADLGFSQPVFAKAINVSAEAVKAWEQGKTPPSGAAKRLLEIAKHYPEIFLSALEPLDTKHGRAPRRD
jgi:putative transcriptional regulator